MTASPGVEPGHTHLGHLTVPDTIKAMHTNCSTLMIIAFLEANRL